MMRSEHRRTRRFAKVVVLSLIVFSAVGCKTQEVQCHWPSEPIKIDGQMSEWEDRGNIYFEKNGVLLGLRSDNDNLYILLRFRDRSWLQAIRATGLTIWLDDHGNKDKNFGLRYNGIPLPIDSLMAGRGAGGGRSGDMRGGMMEEMEKKMQERMVANPVQLCLIDESRWYEPMPLPEDGRRGPAVAHGNDNGLFTYEFNIPLQSMADDVYGFGVKPGQKICIGGEWGEMNTEELRPSMGGGGRGGGGGMGGGKGGGMGGGRGGGMDRPEMPEKQEFWVKTILPLSAEDNTDNNKDGKVN
ncbi:MAG: hypothetical protein GY841_09570 [FCB group bacterium]|nr:hypothetical protein [FCB group bacterium]